MHVIEVTTVDDAAEAGVARLLPQLSSSGTAITRHGLEEIVASPVTRLLAATGDDGRWLGMTTLVVFRLPSGLRAWIEDVVVDEEARGRGVGEALTREALECARRSGARTVELTSRPSREAANRLYRRLGFALRETNVYRFDLAP